VDGQWTFQNNTRLDEQDPLNGERIDRHFCVSMDVNRDSLTDIICNVGADLGAGDGYNELYLTNPNGSLYKVLVSGLQSYVVAAAQVSMERENSQLIFRRFAHCCAVGPRAPKVPQHPEPGRRHPEGWKESADVRLLWHQGPPADGRQAQRYESCRKFKQWFSRNLALLVMLSHARRCPVTVHQMYKNAYTQPSAFPYFREVPGPWKNYQLEASCAVAGDFSRDRRDDLIVCHLGGPPLLAVQQPTGDRFARVNLPSKNPYLKNWRNVRLADVTQDKTVDLLVVTWDVPSYLYVFRGIRGSPYFNFTRPYYQAKLPYSSPDLEVLDVNRDRIPDIYVVQANEQRGSYCHKDNASPADPLVCPAYNPGPADAVPPLDAANDLLFVGTGNVKARQFAKVAMNHSEPGCGWIAQKWDKPSSMLLQGSSFNQAGSTMILEW
jgi:hypothetical protein